LRFPRIFQCSAVPQQPLKLLETLDARVLKRLAAAFGFPSLGTTFHGSTGSAPFLLTCTHNLLPFHLLGSELSRSEAGLSSFAHTHTAACACTRNVKFSLIKIQALTV
jgi:hypothetical protein